MLFRMADCRSVISTAPKPAFCLHATFIIDENGIIKDIIAGKQIKTKTHGEQLLAR